MSNINEKQRCRKLYSQIISGYTPALFFDSQVFLKHFSDNEFSSFEEEYEHLFNEAVEKGLSSEKEKLKELIELEHWTKEEEQQIEDTAGSITLATKQLSEVPAGDGHQRNSLRKWINGLSDTLRAFQKSKGELMGTTAEMYAQRKNNERIILNSIHKDNELKIPYYTEEEFDNISQDELIKGITLYNVNMESFTEKWIKKIATMPSFLNSFFLCNDDPVIFYGKAVVDLTIYQTDLFSKGKYYKSILNECISLTLL